MTLAASATVGPFRPGIPLVEQSQTIQTEASLPTKLEFSQVYDGGSVSGFASTILKANWLTVNRSRDHAIALGFNLLRDDLVVFHNKLT